jgi:hypothetical protein
LLASANTLDPTPLETSDFNERPFFELISGRSSMALRILCALQTGFRCSLTACRSSGGMVASPRTTLPARKQRVD